MPWSQVRTQSGSPSHPGNPALDIESTALHPAPGQAGGWWHVWLSGDSPDLQITPGPIQPAPSQAWNTIPAKVLTDARHLGCLQSLHPKNTGPSH